MTNEQLAKIIAIAQDHDLGWAIDTDHEDGEAWFVLGDTRTKSYGAGLEMIGRRVAAQEAEDIADEEYDGDWYGPYHDDRERFCAD